MSLWKRFERAMWTGPVAKDYGVVSESHFGAGTRTVSALLSNRDNSDRFIIKASHKAFFAASVQYLDLDREGAVRLRAALDDALQTMR
jgi:hypothetical protein